MKLKVFFAAAIAATVSVAKDVVVECADFRLTLDSVGYAKSLVVKSTGEECLAQDVCIPFATLRQDRPYDNEAHLIHPAKPVSFPSDSIVRNGDMLEIGFAREYHVLKLRITISDGYVAFTPEGTDYRITDDLAISVAPRLTESSLCVSPCAIVCASANAPTSYGMILPLSP